MENPNQIQDQPEPAARDPKTDPQEGDELLSPKIKALVISIETGVKGTERVTYLVAHPDHEYNAGLPTTVTMEEWLRFAGAPGVRSF